MVDAVGLAISLAGTALQLVVFSINFVQDAKQVYRHGATDRNFDLAMVSRSIEYATGSLEDQLQSMTEESETQFLDPDTQQLNDLSRRAAEVGRELTQKLKAVTNSEKSKWKSLKAVISGMWNANDIQNIEKRLSVIRDQIQFTVLVGLRRKVNESHNDIHARMLAALEEAANHRAESKEDSKRIIKILNHNDEVDDTRHQELIKLGNQLLESINTMSLPIPTTVVSQGRASLVDDEEAHKRANDSVLNSLWYPSMRDREETISEAHKNTFQWIYEDPVTMGKPWGNFAEFLRTDSKAYWVTGKPGSGKSTFMKFVNENRQTQTLLEEWAGENLVMASFYFFYSGGDLQKTEYGLFRSLLYSILDKRRDLISIAFRNHHQATLNGRRCREPSLAEAKGALKKLLAYDADLKFFVSIDGLDEFDPKVALTSVTNLIQFTHFLEDCGNVKIVVSSRPLPEFERGYRGRPSLRMHDLSENDIRQYARERLMKHERMQRLAELQPQETDALLQTIGKASLGVFLWVRLVTDSLLNGLTNYETTQELRERLDAIPSDLEDLYRNMLLRVEPRYRAETARLLLLLCQYTRSSEKANLLDLWFAERADSELVYRTKVQALTDNEVQERVEESERRLNSRCLGLIEVIHDQPETQEIVRPRSFMYDYTTEHTKAIARFLHRSVFEFLKREDAEAEFITPHGITPSDTSSSLLQAAILGLKGFRASKTANWVTLLHLAGVTAVRAYVYDGASPKTSVYLKLMAELDSAMGELVNTLDTFHVVRRNNPGSVTGAHWSCWIQYMTKDNLPGVKLDTSHGSLVTFAAQHRLSQYIGARVKKNGLGVLRKEGMPVLGYALILSPRFTSRWFFYGTRTLEMLLDNQCDPNALYEGKSVWSHFNFCDLEASMPPLLKRETEALGLPLCLHHYVTGCIEHMVGAGANPNDILVCSIPKSQSKTYCTLLLTLRRSYDVLSDAITSGELTELFGKRDMDSVLDGTMRTINLVKAKGGVEKEWVNEEMIASDPIVSQSSEEPSPAKGNDLDKDLVPPLTPEPSPPISVPSHSPSCDTAKKLRFRHNLKSKFLRTSG
ncbi:hypothetical protein F5Y16DRAFT_387367 [Xylariaceae sp. FL0255]|nr:hypothetical protein F5Y16DRAFT_387367 [Xylariaceae sp. FL0255]